MKTLKFMLAAATAIGIASVASAAQYTGASTGFEKFTQNTKAKWGALDSSGANDYYFWYDDTNQDDNESEIVALTGDLSTGVERPKGTKKFTGADAVGNNNALQVSTGTKPLLRTIKPAAADGPLPGEDILTSTYVDTLVQFTVTPSTDTVTPGENDKLMIYLKENAVMDQDGAPTGETTTNLMVTAGYCGVDGAISAKAYKASLPNNVEVEPGKWYRLTVEAIPDITVENDPSALPTEPTEPTEKNGFVGFVVRINNSQCQFSDPMYDGEDETAEGIFAGSYLKEAIDGKMLVLSLLAASENESKDTLQAVGFAGEGLVDDLVITTSDPFSTMFNFTLNLGANVDAIDYTIGGLPYSQNEKFVEDLKAGTVIMIQSITYAAGFELDSLTTAGLTATAENTYTIDGGDVDPSITITAKASASAGYPAYIPAEDATIKGLYDDWKANVAGAGDVSAAQNQFLLNTAASNEAAAGDATLKITSIAQNANGGWDIVIGCTVDKVKLYGNVGDYQVCNGYLAIEYASELGAAVWKKENIAVSAVDTEAGTVTVNVNKPEAKFLKAELSLTKAPTVVE